MGVPAVWAIAASAHTRTWRRMALTALAVWIAAQAAGTAAFAARQRPDKAFKQRARAEAVAFAENAGLRTVRMVGGPVFGLHGQHLTFRSRGRVRFISSHDEREYRAERAAETDPSPGWLCETSLLDAVLATLQDLRAAYRVDRGEWYSLVHHVAVPLRGRLAIPPAAMRMEFEGAADRAAALTDRHADTWVDGIPGDGTTIHIDLGRTRMVDSLWLVAPDPAQTGLPSGYRLEAASEPEDFRTLRDVSRRIAVGYTLGDRTYLKGTFGVMEIQCEPVPARFLRLSFASARDTRTPWRLSELFVFESAPPAETPPDPAGLRQALTARAIDFVATDRMLSAFLNAARDAEGSGPAAFLPYNAAWGPSHLPRHIPPRRGIAIAPRTELAAECRSLLQHAYGPTCIREELAFPPWHLFLLDDTTVQPGQDESLLLWNGLTLLQSTGMAGDLPPMAYQ
jgi:hypothetical protein